MHYSNMLYEYYVHTLVGAVNTVLVLYVLTYRTYSTTVWYVMCSKANSVRRLGKCSNLKSALLIKESVSDFFRDNFCGRLAVFGHGSHAQESVGKTSEHLEIDL